ncbi:MAG: hypothetical protein EBR85_00015 [Betaproteobacteria bacterium]|jgi:hypothetical protein|nr:hypothetical protein [Betaproteobacteria bacterium]
MTRFRREVIFGIAIPFIYLVFELGFTHQLVSVLSGTASDEILKGLEFWARVISGVGLGLVCFRLKLFGRFSDLVRLIAFVSLGIVVMWNAQRELTEYLVRSAKPEDKQAAVALSLVAKYAGEGRLRLSTGEPVIWGPLDRAEKDIVMALFPAAALHTTGREAQFTQWVFEHGNFSAGLTMTTDMEYNAYKNLIIPPIVIGISLFFALLNISFLVGTLANLIRPGMRWPLMVMSLLTLILVSFVPRNALVDSPGYLNAMRAGLWKEKPVLGALVEWSSQTAPAWSFPSYVAHEFLMGGYSFKQPRLPWPSG